MFELERRVLNTSIMYLKFKHKRMNAILNINFIEKVNRVDKLLMK